MHDKPERPKREHKGKIAVAESDVRWCSDGFGFSCDSGEKLRVTFALDCGDWASVPEFENGMDPPPWIQKRGRSRKGRVILPERLLQQDKAPQT